MQPIEPIIFGEIDNELLLLVSDNTDVQINSILSPTQNTAKDFYVLIIGIPVLLLSR